MWDRFLGVMAGPTVLPKILGADLSLGDVFAAALFGAVALGIFATAWRIWPGPQLRKRRTFNSDWFGEPPRPNIPEGIPGMPEKVARVYGEVAAVKAQTLEVRAIVDAQAVSQAAMTEAVERIEAQVTPNHGSTDTLHQQLVDGLARIKADQVEALSQIKADQETWWAHSAGERQRIRDEVGKQLAKQAAELKRIGRELAAHTHDGE